MTTSDTSTPMRAIASAKPSASSDLVERVGDRVTVLGEQRPAEVGDERDERQRRRVRAACSVVNGTGGTIGQRRGGGDGGAVAVDPGAHAGGEVGERRRAASIAWKPDEPAEERDVVVAVCLESQRGRDPVGPRGRCARRGSCRTGLP